jgi:RimJ/RimL family protein N-acetyltransferase
VTIQMALLRRAGRLRDGRAFVVRPMSEDDAAAVVALRDAVAAEGTYIAARPGERTVTEELLAHTGLLSQGGLAVVADVDNTLAGHLLVQRRVDEGDTADLAIIVSNSARDGGLGREMMRTAMEWAGAVRLQRLCLCVFDDNDRAIALYRSLGFSDTGGATCDIPGGQRPVRLMRLDLQ